MTKNTKAIYLVVFIIFIFFSGCAKEKINNDVKSSNLEIERSAFKEREIKTLSYRTLKNVDDAIKIIPEVEVRMATDSELSSIPGLWQGKEVAGFSAFGIGSLGLGLVAPPLYASALVVGGILLVAMPSSLGAISGIQRNTIKKVLTTTDFSDLTQKAVVESFDYNQKSKSDGYKLTILILAYGFVEKFSDEICFSVDAEIKLRLHEKEIYRDFIYIEPYLRSEDAPPPQCALVGEFAENNGKIVKQTIKDFSTILASIVTHRLSILAWKKY